MASKDNWWSGVSAATAQQHYNAMYDRFGRGNLTSCLFQVTDDLSRVRIAYRDEDQYAADGLWTLAEIHANGADDETISRVARKMRKAIKQAEATCLSAAKK